MPGNRHKVGRRLAKVAGLTGFLGLLLGYLIFYVTFPNASVPTAGESNLLFAIGLLMASAILVGLLSDDLVMAIVQAFLAIPLGATVATALVLSPALAGLMIAQAEEVVVFVLRLGFPMFLAALPINLVCTVLGVAAQERLRLGRP